jgi:hypothetical protein
LAAAALFIAIIFFAAIALLAATALFAAIILLATALLAAARFAALLFGSRRFDRFVRIALCFHGPFLYCTY